MLHIMHGQMASYFKTERDYGYEMKIEQKDEYMMSAAKYYPWYHFLTETKNEKHEYILTGNLPNPIFHIICRTIKYVHTICMHMD